MTDETRIEVPLLGGRYVSAILTTSAGGPSPSGRGQGEGTRSVVVYAPGAGSNLNDPFGRFLAASLAGAGIDSLRFQFPYMEAMRRGPDRPSVLEATWRAVLDVARGSYPRVVAAGRSMGGRIASQVVAQGEPVDALVLFAYPLHPPGRPDQMRDAHLRSIAVPTLLCSGSRDAFASPEELTYAAAKLPRSRLHLLDGAGHGFDVLRSSGRTRQDVWSEAVEVSLDFLRSVLPAA